MMFQYFLRVSAQAHDMDPMKGFAVQTPYYLIDKSHLLTNLDKIAQLRAASGANCLLAL